MTDTNVNAENRQVLINAQYVKDLSFENPNAPMSLTGKGQPKIDISVDINVKALQKEVFEVELRIESKAKRDGEDLFLVEVSYAGVFTVSNIPEGEKEFLLMVYCPNMLFPFARRVVADATRDGGFPPLMMDPIDFGALYQQRKTADAQKQTESVN